MFLTARIDELDTLDHPIRIFHGGADEAAAQQAEEQLWMEFIVAQRVDQTRGIRYLALLKERR